MHGMYVKIISEVFRVQERVNISLHVTPFCLYVNNAKHMAFKLSCHVKVSGELMYLLDRAEYYLAPNSMN
jgi:hypothetical protein